MANRSDNAPKQFRQMPCSRCGEIFQSTGPSSKRCDPCKRLHKREYEAVAKRAKVARQSACLRCAEPFDSEMHGHQRYCGACAKAAHSRKATEAHVRRYHRVYKHDPGYKLHNSISGLIRRGLNGAKCRRRWQALVGYTLDDLRRHLRRQFVKGMTWDNYGTDWHIDHILPRASFTFTSPDEEGFKACWALTNLRPLWSELNIKKGAKRLHLL